MTIYVKQKSGVTQQIALLEQQGCTCFRTRLECGCQTANRRSGAIAIKCGLLYAMVVKCRACDKGGAL